MNNTTDIQGRTEKEFLLNYNPDMFERLSLSVDAVIFSVDTKLQTTNYRKLDEQKLTVLLVKRNEHPFLGKWSLPGGFVGIDESVDVAAMRITKNKTGLDDLYLEQLYTFGNPNRDPRMRIISCAYLSLLDRSEFVIKSSPLVADSAWFEISALNNKELFLTHEDEKIAIPFEKMEISNGKIKLKEYIASEGNTLAFDHADIILKGLMRLRDKIDSTDIVFNLMPEEFTLTQLQQIFEIILGQQLLTPAFRRKIAAKLCETGKYSREKGHRPSQYFKLIKERDEKNEL